eukprot:CAMPEP_0179210556 /NCGR_PEP_ID=MMETSP0796-20121207/105017_1 /TAXON_ID=73915 /ORGANISM="Pyrodinium bahamense, Strain pbaha01" /LENGTH=137 /DNA_ID=CAMNT_0020915523 /DNA_START=134 /DNA_END=544 /DNA_ORIENTATION=+
MQCTFARDSRMHSIASCRDWTGGAHRFSGAPAAAAWKPCPGAGHSAEDRVRRWPAAGFWATPTPASLSTGGPAASAAGAGPAGRRRRCRGVTVSTPGASTSHFTPARPAASTECKTPAYQRPSYSTSTRSPTRGAST